MKRLTFPVAFLTACHLAWLTGAPASAVTLEWIRQFGTPDYDSVIDAAVDSFGNIFVAGTRQLVEQRPFPSTAYFRKYDTAGQLLWTRDLSRGADAFATGVSCDALGNEYVGWTVNGNAYLSKYDDAGSLVWSRQLTTGGSSGVDISVDTVGNVFAIGITTANFDRDALMAKLSSAGDLLWSKTFGSTGDDSLFSGSVDALGNFYVAGSTDGDLFGPSLGGVDSVLAKFDSDGSLLWGRHFGTSSYDGVEGLSTDGVGDVLITGSTADNVFVAKFGAEGTEQWTRQLMPTLHDVSYAVSADGFGNVYISGSTFGDLGGINAGSEDAFVAKYDGSGTFQWVQQIGSSRADRSYSVSPDGFGNVYIAGYTTGNLGGSNLGKEDAFLAKYSDLVPEPGTISLRWGAVLPLLWQRVRRRGRRSRRPRSLRPSARRHSHHGRAARFEPLEDRAMLAVTVQVSDVSVVEGNAGPTNLVFTVTRTGDAVPFTVDYSTTNDTATAAATGSTPTFTRHTIDSTSDDPQRTVAADIDSDDDLDALTASYQDHTIAWYENDGSGNFQKHLIAVAPNTPETWTGPVSVAATDLDGDGDVDVLGALQVADTFAWYENDGNENFTAHVIDAAADVAHSVEAADVDGDSDLDIVGASVGDDTLAWYQNDGNENFVKHVITNAIDGMLAAVAADIDGDGDQDVLSCSGNGDTVAWHENDGGGNFVTHLISTTVDAANSVSAVDLDGDGDMDFLTTSGGLAANRKILWYENDGAQNFAEHVISNDRLSATMATAGDIDNDGDLDIVYATQTLTGGIGWYENDGAQNFSLHVLTSIWSGGYLAAAADMDGDGDRDVLANLRSNDMVAWFENSLVNPVPADYLPTSGTLSFTATETQKTVTVSVLGDATIEADERFYVTFDTGSVSQVRAFGTIVNDDVPPTKFYVVDDASANSTYEYQVSGGANENYALASGNSAPRGAASTVAGDTVWVVDTNRKVYVYDTAGGLLGSWSAGSMSKWAKPEGIATNGTDVWIVDSYSDKVYKYAGAAGRLSGNQNAASSFNLNSGNRSAKDIVTDGASLWVVNDTTTDKVFKYTVAGSLVGSWAIDAANSKPTGITLDPASASDVWIVDSGTDRVYEYTTAAGRTSGSQAASASFALAAGNANPQGIADPPASSRLSLDGETAPKTWLSRTMDRVQVVSATLPSKPTARKTICLLARDQVFESLDRRRLDEPHRSIWRRREFDSDLGLPDRTDATSRNDSKQNLAFGSEWDSLVEILADKATGHRRSAGWHGRGT